MNGDGLIPMNRGIGCLEVEAGGEQAFAHGQGDFDDTGNASGGFGVADVGLDGADSAGILAIGTRDGGADGFNFDGVAGESAGAVSFDVGNGLGIDSRVGEGSAKHGLLAVAAWRN